ncbi:uncharacterized protein OCT59_027914 [Rhizophagus irregularis]|uniref:uncharacterized protein n=1 Tax=Rhizophagus irregularis TaxID=588596 RepID=UPI00332AA4FB|nr:hypothetical protein OCT59_027914 [Rhizophagus irregularis]
MDFRCFDFGKRTEIMVFRSSTSESEMECRTKLRPGLWKKGSGRLDETNGSRCLDNGNRNEPVPDVRMMETTGSDVRMMKMTGSGRLDNGNRNEPVPDVRMMETTGSDVRMMETTSSGRLDNGNRNEPVPDVWIMELKTNRFSPASTWHQTLDT